MTRDRRLLLLLGLLMAYGLFVVECRYHQREDATTTEPRHRHRHRHESSNRRGHHEFDRKSWQEVDYEYDGDLEEPIDEDDYEARPYYDRSRSHHQSAQKNYHGRMFQPRYPPRYHNDGYRAESGWYDESNDRRRVPSRYNAKNYRYRPGRTYHRPAYTRNRDVSDFDDSAEEDYDYERPHRYGNGEAEHRERWRNSRRHSAFKRDWRNRMNHGHHGARRHRLEDREDVVDRIDVTKWADEWKRKFNFSDSKYHFAKDEQKAEEDEDYEDHGGLEEDDKDEDEDDIWKDIADDRNEDNEEEELDNDFYKSETKAPLKTYDDIIRRLTSNDPTTPKTTVKRDYRNIESNKHVKRDGYKNLKHEPRNISRPVDFFTNTSRAAGSSPNYFVNKRTENSTIGSAEHKPSKNTVGGVVKDQNQQEGKTADAQAKTKSLEDYDEYPNNPDNEKEDDPGRAEVEDDSTMQADVTNTDYTDDDNGDEDEADTFATSSTTTTTTTTTTTVRPKPSLSQHYDFKDPRAYDSGTGAQYNGYQAKNDYPPMSAHSIHKWQSLGTREGVKETRSNMQQYNKNGKSAEIREALQHAIKVNKEGSCQWPRARVIPVRDVYPSPSTTYIPHCAILHRCSDDTGCCRSEALTCVPKHSHRVELSFYTTIVGGASVVEKLSFYNHTECECRERSEYTTNEKPAADQGVHRHHQSSLPPQNIKKPPAKKPCRCPSEFTPRIMEGICQCNCYETNENCIKTKRGKVYFSLADRICIQNNECALPNCEFGDYMKLQGKCPRKRDTFDALTNYRTNMHHRFRS
ncbi:hypothetical protein PUN28_018577 [Cardiocondyla obscurior]|uniref:Platelet-derived growth factor (PDGF) family profile domain-containing protein n=1 Tax=Cardiocondyla obscurior TaxID=286306 RepID=A0AAW2EEK5_9HYME